MDKYESFIGHLSIIPDFRTERRKKHKLIDILFIALCTILSGGERFSDMVCFAAPRIDWLKKYIELPSGIPSYYTFRRVFGILDPDSLKLGLMTWTESLRGETSGQVIALAWQQSAEPSRPHKCHYLALQAPVVREVADRHGERSLPEGAPRLTCDLAITGERTLSDQGMRVY